MKPVNGIIGIADISASRQRLRVSGGDRVEFLHGQCTNDIKRLATGESCYAAFLNAKGKIRGEGHIIRLEDAFLLEVNPGLAQSLEKFIITEDVTIEDVSARWGEWVVIGDTAARLPPEATTFSHPLGVGVIGEGPMADTINAETLEMLRIESAVPKWGVDMDENTIPNEAGLEARAISYDKGCYIGQETVARIKTYGHVNRRLIQCQVQSAQEPQRGDKIFEGEGEVGHVTSAVRSLRLGKPVVLGYVRREFARTGIKLACNNEPVEVLRVCGD
jgi:folate-binding protein YgfZ